MNFTRGSARASVERRTFRPTFEHNQVIDPPMVSIKVSRPWLKITIHATDLPKKVLHTGAPSAAASPIIGIQSVH
jgi:hypothetical protein